MELVTPQGGVGTELPQADMQAALALVRGCSSALQSLLASMLDPSPALRITADAALRHPFFADAFDVCDGGR